ncbi:uncharacterized protein TM35_000015060 [Trypanosoma theileri]|uniref:Transcription factor CBF/NF-Y/archaeal histone domain-containing protein n=1 Tax=Trypanosoma theileri TaxID=67003 RepID=A0A1X0PAL6_9TRYP|nr:uncharacterized protein TM35_000015060 [Trypanosoma theileri]ORC93629.1 hypothetical protein TM35_000015060 [Trypanosoma theileri]
MEEEGREGINEEMYETMEDGQTLDIHEAAFLTPRLAVFTDGGNQETETFNEYNGDQAPRGVSAISTRAEEDSLAVLGDTEDIWEKDIAHAALLNRDEEKEQQVQHSFDYDETAPIAGMFFATGEEHEEEENDMNDPNEEEENEDEDGDDVMGNVDSFHPGGSSAASPNAAAGGGRSTFPLSRVRELLKFHGLSSIVAKDAALTASDAVVLMLRDFTRLAAAEAERQQRKTVTYTDVARVVHYFDRFSFLSDIIPQPPESHSGTAKVMVGSGKLPTALASTSAAAAAGGARAGRGGARDGVSRHQTKGGATTEEGGRLRQATLRF